MYQRSSQNSQEKVECIKQNEEKGPKNIFHLCFSLSFSHLNINFYFLSLSGGFMHCKAVHDLVEQNSKDVINRIIEIDYPNCEQD